MELRRKYLLSCELTETEKEVILKAYGLEAENEKKGATAIAVGLHVSTPHVVISEGKAIKKLRSTNIINWLEKKIEEGVASAGEILLLEAFDKTDPEKEEPYIFAKEIVNGGDPTETTGSAPQTDAGSKLVKPAIESGVGKGNAKGKRKKSGKTDSIPDNDPPGHGQNNPNIESRNEPGGHVFVCCVRGASLGEFNTNLNQALATGQYGFVETVSVFNQSNKRLEYIAFLVSGVVIEQESGVRNSVTITSKDPVDLIAHLSKILNDSSRRAFTLSFSAHYNSNISRIEHTVTVTYI